jgi:hypothetical protein
MRLVVSLVLGASLVSGLCLLLKYLAYGKPPRFVVDDLRDLKRRA